MVRFTVEQRWLRALILTCLICQHAVYAYAERRVMEVTAYCKCGQCNGYVRGSWKYLKMDFWNRYVSEGSQAGQRYDGRTASGGKLRQSQAGLLSADSVTHPWKIPVRALTPWNWISHSGTIAADTDYYPFGTRMYVPGYGWGIVQDRGGDIKGPDRLDIFFKSHSQTLRWGRQRLEVEIRK